MLSSKASRSLGSDSAKKPQNSDLLTAPVLSLSSFFIRRRFISRVHGPLA